MGIILAILLAQFAHRSTPGDPKATAPTITSTGSAPGTGCVTLTTGGAAIAFVSITGTWTATLAFFGSNDGWATTKVLGAYAVTSGVVGTTAVTTTTANGDWVVKLLGVREAGVCASAFTSGPASVRIDADPTAGGLASAGTGTVTFSANTLTASGAGPIATDSASTASNGGSILSVGTGGGGRTFWVQYLTGKPSAFLCLDSGCNSSLGELSTGQLFSEDNAADDGTTSFLFKTAVVKTSGLLFDLQRNDSVSEFKVDFAGNVTIPGALTSGTPTSVTSKSEHDFCAYNAANLAGATAFAQTGVTNASTLVASSAMVHDIASAGTGTFVVKLCSDGVTCGAGNVYLTCTAGANCATAAAGRIDACTVTKAAVSAATTLTWSVGTACGTTDPGVNVCAHMTTP